MELVVSRIRCVALVGALLALVACGVAPVDSGDDTSGLWEGDWKPGPTHPGYADAEFVTAYGVSDADFADALEVARERFVPRSTE